MAVNFAFTAVYERMMKRTFLRCLSAVALVWGIFVGSLAAQEHTLVFYARPPALSPYSLGGHAFVSWVTEDSLHQFRETVYGFYPAKPRNFLTMWFKTTGKVVEGFEANYAKNLWMVDCLHIVSDPDFHRSLHEARLWEGSRYHLFGRNCLAFMDAVADHVGLKTPSTRRFFILPKSPTRYVRQLIRLNAH